MYVLVIPTENICKDIDGNYINGIHHQLETAQDKKGTAVRVRRNPYLGYYSEKQSKGNENSQILKYHSRFSYGIIHFHIDSYFVQL